MDYYDLNCNLELATDDLVGGACLPHVSYSHNLFR